MLAVLGWGELVHLRAAIRERRLAAPTPGGNLVVVILGFGNRGRRANVVNRWRARIGVRTARAARASGSVVTIVCSGGAVHGPVPEAVLLQEYVLHDLGWDGPVVIEPRSTSTWENVRNTLLSVECAESTAFASNGLHAEKARLYLARQRPDLAERMVPAMTYRLGEMPLLKPVFAAVGLWQLRSVFHVKRAPGRRGSV